MKEIFSLSEGIFKETESKFYNAQFALSHGDLKCFIVAFILLFSNSLREGLNARSYADNLVR